MKIHYNACSQEMPGNGSFKNYSGYFLYQFILNRPKVCTFQLLHTFGFQATHNFEALKFSCIEWNIKKLK